MNLEQIAERLERLQEEMDADNRTAALKYLMRAVEDMNWAIRFAADCGISQAEVEAILGGTQKH